MKKLIRTEFPKIRVVRRGGKNFYQVDARRKGTLGKQKLFPTIKQAEERASEIAKDFAATGLEGLALDAELRGMALSGARMLEPFGRTVQQACEFYRDHLTKEQARLASALIPALAERWHADKKSGSTKKLRESTLKDIRAMSKTLAENFQGIRILDLTETDVEAFIEIQDVGLQRKHNLLNLFKQFLNWCVRKKHIAKSPVEDFKIEVGNKEVSVMSAQEAQNLLRICEERFPQFVLYHAICLFAGLRPEECQFLEWGDIHLGKRIIHVRSEISKINESRNVHFGETLRAWLLRYKPEGSKPTEFVTPQTNFKNYTLQIHIAAGYRGTLVKTVDRQKIKTVFNEDKPTWDQDILRHSFGSHWLERHGDRARLAEEMGNSLKIIKKHYRRVVDAADCSAYWSILPSGVAETVEREWRLEESKF